MIKLNKIMNNCHKVTLNNIELYFSYETIVGFYSPSTGIILCENIWGTTTGKHLNAFGDKYLRIPKKEFEKKLEEVML